jgi:hypothetical protein
MGPSNAVGNVWSDCPESRGIPVIAGLRLASQDQAWIEFEIARRCRVNIHRKGRLVAIVLDEASRWAAK